MPLQSNARYQMTLADLRTALQNIRDHGGLDTEDAMDWYYAVFDEFMDDLGGWDYIDGNAHPDFDEREIPGVPCARSIFSDIYEALLERFEYDESDENLDDMLGWIDTYVRDHEKPLIERALTHEQKVQFLNLWDMDQVEATDIPGIQELYVKTVNELAAENHPQALHEKAYACYGDGCAGFSQDWEASRDCLLKLEEISPDSRYANTLGYIYYYGRCTNGTPEYDKAFYWFSIGAAGGSYESRYKLSDLFKKGTGCPKDMQTAESIIWELFNQNLPYFCTGERTSKFADIALRAGNIEREGLSGAPDADSAFAYYLMAKLAIRMRRQAMDYIGDESVERRIDKALADVLPESSFAEKQEKLTFDESGLPRLLRFALGNGRRMEMDYRWKDTDKGNLKLVFRVQDKKSELDTPAYHASKFPVLIPEAHFCGMREKLVVRGTVQRSAAYGLVGKGGTIVFDEVGSAWDEFGKLMLYGKLAGALHGTFTVNCRKLAGKKRRYASVNVEPGTRTRDYLCDDKSIEPGSHVLVPTGNGHQHEATVVRVTWRYDSEMPLFRRDYRKVIAPVTSTCGLTPVIREDLA
ncbi:MAG: tetratricopeptide repeat protein [Eggerthellaceae bacterium]